jgi:hypothetical protein
MQLQSVLVVMDNLNIIPMLQMEIILHFSELHQQVVVLEQMVNLVIQIQVLLEDLVVEVMVNTTCLLVMVTHHQLTLHKVIMEDQVFQEQIMDQVVVEVLLLQVQMVQLVLVEQEEQELLIQSQVRMYPMLVVEVDQ